MQGAGQQDAPPATAPWARALQALRLFAIDPAGLGGVSLRAPPGEVRACWLAALGAALPSDGVLRKMPASIDDTALLGGLDLAATLQAGRPVQRQGLLAAATGGVLIAAMAERMPAALAGRLALALDAGDGAGGLAIVALDEGIAPEEATAAALLDRLAFHLDFSALTHRDLESPDPAATSQSLAAARARLDGVMLPEAVLEALCESCAALGIGSARAPLLALRAARAEAAWQAHGSVTFEDAALAASLVLGPRATRLPPPQEAAEPESPPELPPSDDQAAADPAETPPDGAELLLAAAAAAIPPGLLARLRAQDFRGGAARESGRQGAARAGTQRGRPVGTRAAPPGPGARLSLIETLRAAAPWQPLRAAQFPQQPPGRIQLRRDDFRVVRTAQRSRTTTIFLVDASGSAAFARLAEAKGAVELLLADCYQRRDQVALLAFRGTGAQILLPPTRSLVRAKRSLAGLPGGGGTPMAAGIDAGFLLAETLRRAGIMPTLVLLTDGRANVTRAGTAGRARALSEAEDAARRVRAAGFSALLLDTSPRTAGDDASPARALASALGALYVPLPYASAAALSAAVRAARPGGALARPMA